MNVCTWILVFSLFCDNKVLIVADNVVTEGGSDSNDPLDNAKSDSNSIDGSAQKLAEAQDDVKKAEGSYSSEQLCILFPMPFYHQSLINLLYAWFSFSYNKCLLHNFF